MIDVVSFYSFKGGAGRTSTTFNTIPFIAKEYEATRKEPILVLDMDFDSAGITYLLNEEHHFANDNNLDVVDFVINGSKFLFSDNSIENHPFFCMTRDISSKFGLEAGSVLFLGVNDKKSKRMDLSAEKVNVSALVDLQTSCDEAGFKAIVIDSASGTQKSAQLAKNISNILVCCLKATSQFRVGTFRYIEEMVEGAVFKSRDRLILLPVAIPAETKKYSDDRKNAKAKLQEWLRGLKFAGKEDYFISEDVFGIPEVEGFKWQESLLYSKSSTELELDEKLALKQYEKLASVINSKE